MPDFVFLLETRLSPEQLRVVERVQQAATHHGLHLYLVGGALRDMIYGYPVRDLDFAVEGPAQKVIKSLLKNDVQVLQMNEKLRLADLQFPGDVTVEIAACRAERRNRPGQAPVIDFAGIYEDLRRRDFSMNAIGLSLNPNSRGLLLDPNNGVADIERHEVRVLHNYSFLDDPVRIIRAVRFATRLRFTLEAKTESLFRSALENRYIQSAAIPSLLKEFRELAREDYAVDILRTLAKEGLITAFHPRLDGARLNLHILAQANKVREQFEDEGIALHFFGPFLHFLLAKLSARERSDLVRRLGMKRADTDPWMHLPDQAKRLATELTGKNGNTPSKAYQLLEKQPGELLLFLLLGGGPKKAVDKVKNYLHRQRKARQTLPGAELATLGVAPESPRYQKILDAYFLGVLDGKVRASKDPLKALKKLVNEIK